MGMGRVVFFFLVFCLGWGAQALSPDQYAQQVLQKDVPRSLRWYGKMSQASSLGQIEVYKLYRSALPETQENRQLGISVKGSVERMSLLLEGSRYFDQVQSAPGDFQNKKENIAHVLQATKDQLDRLSYGEDPQNLLEEWPGIGMVSFESFAADLVEVFAQLQKLLTQVPGKVVEERPDAEAETEVMVAGGDSADEAIHAEKSESTQGAASTAADAVVSEALPPSFEQERFSSYVQSVEAGKVATECQTATMWQTELADSCQNDNSPECDRSYARQCKKLQ